MPANEIRRSNASQPWLAAFRKQLAAKQIEQVEEVP